MEITIHIAGGTGSIVGETCDECHSVIAPKSEFEKHKEWHNNLYQQKLGWPSMADGVLRQRVNRGGRKRLKESEKRRPKINIRKGR